MGRVRGDVKWFDAEKGWGFIRLDDGAEVFVHHSDIQGEGFRTLHDGDAVELEVEAADRGPRARRVAREGEAPVAQESPKVPREPRAPDAGAGSAGTGSRKPRSRTAGPPDRASAADGPGRTLEEQVRATLSARYPFAR